MAAVPNAAARHGYADGESRQPTHLDRAHGRVNETGGGLCGDCPSAAVGVVLKARRGGLAA